MFKVGDRVRCIRGVEGDPDLAMEPLKTGEHYIVSLVDADDIRVEGIPYYYVDDRFVKID